MSVSGVTFYLVSILFLNVCFALSQLKCKSCNLPLNGYRTEVFKNLHRLPESDVCVWADKNKIESDSFNFIREVNLLVKTVINLEIDRYARLPQKCLHNIIFTDALVNLCDKLPQDHLQYLSELHSVYVLVHTSWELWDHDFPQCFEKFGSAHVMFFTDDARVFSLSSPLVPPRIIQSADLQDILQPVPVNTRDLGGRVIKVAAFNCSPFVIFDRFNESGKHTGIDWEVLRELSNHLNFTLHLVQLRGNKKWGNKINGTWNGGIGKEVSERNADIGICGILNTEGYYQIMDFGPPTKKVAFTFIVPRPQLVQYKWQSLVDIFADDVWLCTLVVYMLTSACYWLCCTWQSHSGTGFEESLVTTLGMLTLASWWSRPRARRLVVWWCVFAMLLTAVFNSGIEARLTLPRYEPRIDTVRRLVELRFHWYDTNYSLHKMRAIYFNLENTWQMQWEQQYKYFRKDQILSALKSRTVAFPIQRWDRFVFFTVEGLDYDRDLASMRVLKETTTERFVSFKFTKRSPIFTSCQLVLLRLGEAGLVSYWTEKVVRTRGERYSKQLLEEMDIVDSSQIKPLTMVNLSPAFFLLASGLIISLLAFITEMW